jgi:hypothetical protein
MRIGGFRVPQPLKMIILSLALLAGFPGTGKAVRPLEAPLYVPKAFRQLEASVVSLRFYASQTDKVVPMQARTYATGFSKGDTRYIWWELCLNNKAKRDRPVPLYIWVAWERPDGTEFTQSVAVTIPANLQQLCLSAFGQDNKPGGWVPGSYRVSIQIDDIEVARGSFEVVQKFLKEH